MQLAMSWLEQAYDDHSNGLVFLKVEPELDPLRSNPRFMVLQQKLNFPNWFLYATIKFPPIAALRPNGFSPGP